VITRHRTEWEWSSWVLWTALGIIVFGPACLAGQGVVVPCWDWLSLLYTQRFY
jgi:hypothetical protein